VADLAIISEPCGFFLLSFLLFSSPNLSGRRLDVYHTSTHGVALVRISNAGLKCAASSSLEIQDAKVRHLGIIAQPCWAISSQLRHVSTIGKKLIKQQYLPHMPYNMVNFGLLAAEIVSLVWGHPCKFQRVSRLGIVTARHSSTGRQRNFAALNRGRRLYSAGRPSRWALAHISSWISIRQTIVATPFAGI